MVSMCTGLLGKVGHMNIPVDTNYTSNTFTFTLHDEWTPLLLKRTTKILLSRIKYIEKEFEVQVFTYLLVEINSLPIRELSTVSIMFSICNQ